MNLKPRGMRIGRLGLIALLTLAGVVHLESNKWRTHAQSQVPNHVRVSAIDDWSHHRTIYSRPSSVAQSLKLKSDPRYQQQLQKRSATAYQSVQ
jgi:hypothetical protein